jgi:hypothetical protein
MTTIVGIFDNTQDVDNVTKRLAAAGFDGTAVYDEAIVAEDPDSVDPAVPTLAPGSAPEVVLGSGEPNLLPRRDKHGVVRAFKAHLADYNLSHDVIEAYATTFEHSGKFVLVKTDAQRAEQTMEILRNSGARGVNQHD